MNAQLEGWRVMAEGVIAVDWPDAGMDFVTEDPALGTLEHYIHEASHAFLLGYKRIDSRTSSRISIKLDKLPECQRVDQEAQTWAAEWHVWEALSLPLEWGDAVEAAYIQGVSESAIKGYLDSAETKSVGEKVVKRLRALVERVSI